MHLYQGSTRHFIANTIPARRASSLSDRFFDEPRFRPTPSETQSWRSSLTADQRDLVELSPPLSLRHPNRGSNVFLCDESSRDFFICLIHRGSSTARRAADTGP